MMKRTSLSVFLLFLCLLTGCENKAEKMCRIEIQGADSTCIASLEQQTQADITDFFDEEHWLENEDTAENLTPEYTLLLYQEKTHTLLKTEKDEPYEKIMEYTTYKDSDIVKAAICQNLVNGGSVSEEVLTAYYTGSEEFFTSIENAVKP